jgi:hypothetical protein
LIRQANKFDKEDIIRIIKDFAINSNNPMTSDPIQWSKTYIETIIDAIFAGKGFILIDEEKSGILVAVRTQCFWLENIYQLQEVMLHGKSKLLMYRLIKEYVKISREMIKHNKISQAVMSSYKDDNFERIGLKKLEVHWSIE